MSERPIFKDDYRLWLLLSQTRAAIAKVRHKKVGQYLHPNQAAALVSIWALNGQITPAALSRRLFLEPHTVSELIIRMQQKGLVTKKKDSRRGNIVRISITKKGREVCQKIMGQQLIHRIMSSLSDRQREQLRACLLILIKKAIEELNIEGELPLLLET